MRKKTLEPLARAKFSQMDRYSSLSDEEKLQLEVEAAHRDHSVPIREFLQFQTFTKDGRRVKIGNNDYYDITSLGIGFRSLLPKEMLTFSEDSKQIAVVFTGRGVGRREGGGIHMRGGFGQGTLAVISTTGIVEAPEKPLELIEAEECMAQLGPPPHFKRKEYNDRIWEVIRKNDNTLDMKLVEEEIADIFKEEMLSHGDTRITEAAKGITVSMAMFALGEQGRAAQCSTSDLASRQPNTSLTCRMHDAHWQQELIASQIKKAGEAEFCNYHADVFSRLQSFKKAS